MTGISTVFFVLSVAVLGLFHAASGQTKEIPYGEVFKMEQAAGVLLRSLPHRSSMTSWVFPECGKEASFKSVLIRETVSSDHSRWIQENDTQGSFRRMEVVTVGGKNYRKIDDGAWHVLPLPPVNMAPPEPPVPSRAKYRFETSARLIDTLNDGNGPVSIYETINKSTRKEDGREITRINTIRIWFRYDGRLLRKDMELETVGEARILKNSTVYEYDGIKIEAPIK